ncbi:MAG: hypothetical protein HKP48_06225 [Winogradskyella sp.]|uniref:hypothetical protein n=1 Tax=Winogradskyella sp. TaxID=1883156 RepID=UPI00184A0C9A|nr:hypothetical protein [Winogradskyella sp.]MBT8244764.1 hypothetical protein [Winogradskyella sp.]NNK22890.1 hypothetical protein [Winogradskyella sp.]
MKKNLLLIISITLTFNGLVAQNWTRYKSEDLAFVAMYPSQPERTVQKIPSAVGELDMHMIMYAPQSGDNNTLYSVIRSDYPKEQFEGADVTYNNNVLDAALEGAVTNVSGKLLKDKKIVFNGYSGRSIKIEIQAGFIYMNAYLVGHIMYITQVITLTNNDGNTSIDKFFSSFDILNVKN